MTTTSSDGRRQPDARLLVVEDEPNILELLSASLRYAGFEVLTAAAGTEAVQAAQRHRPDLIVLDVMLPDMDGFDVIRRLRGGGGPDPGGVPDRAGLHRGQDPRPDPRRRRLRDQAVQPGRGIARIRAVLRRTAATGPSRRRG